jgi:hypothetical protein
LARKLSRLAGGAVPNNALVDSDGVVLIDSDGITLLES